MKFRNVFLVTALLAVVAFAQDTFSPARIYTVGEKDVYGLSMKMETGQFDLSIVGKITYNVKKVYENGDADIENATRDMVINAMGQEMKQADGPGQIRRYNKFGVPVDKVDPKVGKQPAFMNFLAYRTSTPLKVGESVPVNEELNDALKTKVKGTAKLESITDGVAKISTSIDITNTTIKKPMHVDSISYIDVKTSKLNRAESKVTNIEASEEQGMPPVKAITVVMEREKAS